MKECVFNIYPRQMGKTSRLISESLNCIYRNRYNTNYNQIFYILNKNMVKMFVDKMRKFIPRNFDKDIFSIGVTNDSIEFEFDNICKRIEFRTEIGPVIFSDTTYDVFIDEYMMMNQDLKYELNYYSSYFDKVTIYTSPNKLYDKSIVTIVREARKNNDMDFLKSVLRPEYLDAVKELECDLLTHPKTKIYSHYDEYVTRASSEDFETQYLGKLYK